MRQQRGFTLIELIIVIVILGILAVTAAPRFIDIQSDAKASTLDGVKAAMQGASQLVYAKAAINGVQKVADSDVQIAGQTVEIVYGYPDASELTDTTIVRFVDIDMAEFNVETPASGATDTILIMFDGTAETDNCYLSYQEPASANAIPTYSVVTTGC